MTFWHLENSPYIAFLPWINDKIPLLSLPNTSWSCGTCGIYSELTAFFNVNSVDQPSWSKHAENKKYLQTQSNLELKCDTRRWNNGVINRKKGKNAVHTSRVVLRVSHIPTASVWAHICENHQRVPLSNDTGASLWDSTTDLCVKELSPHSWHLF